MDSDNVKNTGCRNQNMIPQLNLKRDFEISADELLKAITANLSGANYILGPTVEQFESDASNYLGVKNCIGVASGTDALVIALRALASEKSSSGYFTKKDEIITTPFTFTATGSSILRSGATPVFVDIDPHSFNIDPQKIESAITENTVGIIPVHLYGQPCKMDEIMSLAKKNSLFVLEDAAQAIGSEWMMKKVGSFGDMAAFSFFPSKNLGCYGDGGMIATNRPDLAETARKLRAHGGKDKYNVEFIGYNSRLDSIQAAVLSVKLKTLDINNDRRRELALFYNDQLGYINIFEIPLELEKGKHVYHQYTLRIGGGKREYIKNLLSEKGIATAVYYPVPLYRMKLFKNNCKVFNSMVNTDVICNEVLSLPMDPHLKEDEINYVVECLKEIYKEGDLIKR